MTMMQPGTHKGEWHATTGPTAELLLSESAFAGWEPITPSLGGVDLRVTVLDAAADIPDEIVRGAQILIVEVRRDQPGSFERFTKLLGTMGSAGTHVIAAVRAVTLDDVRSLLRAGASDVLSLPMPEAELEAALSRIREEMGRSAGRSGPAGKIVSAIKSVGGVGATALLTQLAGLYATREGAAGRETCLIDLDLQFGSAALYLGSLPQLGIKDLIEAGARADGALLRSTMTKHASGLHFMGAPAEMLPLDIVDQDQVVSILGLAAREFGTVFVDLPANWTNWSLSALARSDMILLVCDLTVASLHQARRQMDLIEQQGLGEIPLRIVMNRVEKKLFKTINVRDAERVLCRQIDHTIADDAATIGAALDQGVMIAEVGGRSRVAKDLKELSEGVSLAMAGA